MERKEAIMNKKYFFTSIILSLCISCITVGDRQLERTEILEIFKKLTSQSQTTWISAGTIEADHEEYRAAKTTNTDAINSRRKEELQEYQDSPNKQEVSVKLQKMKLEAIPFNVRYRQSNEYTMNSSEVVKYDGDRFYWEIDISSRTDSVRPSANLEGNYMTDEFNLNYNQKRVFVWDGQSYIHYYLPGNHAVVDTTDSLPRVVNGPLTAGYIYWGDGNYSYESLSCAQTSAEEKYINDQIQIEMTINHSDGSEMKFVMDPKKDYAVSRCTIDNLNTIVSSVYSDYQKVSDSWVPSNISTERYDSRTNRLLSYDIWSFSSISGKTPSGRSFNVEFETDALIQYSCNVTSEPVIYSHSYAIDTDKLLLDKLAYAASEGRQPQNCATAALKYTIGKSGKEVTNQQLSQLVSKQDKTTSLYEMKKFVQGQGLYCRAVKLDIDSLGKLQGCEAILHLPKINHFVVLGEIDESHVGSVDFTSSKFYFRKETSSFDMAWANGTALLISQKPIEIEGNFTEISNSGLHKISGGNGWECDEVIQEDDTVNCDTSGGGCGGLYEEYYRRKGCVYTGSGSCSQISYVRKIDCSCKINGSGYCVSDGNWTTYYIWACQ
jgi:hypothetical protein